MSNSEFTKVKNKMHKLQSKQLEISYDKRITRQILQDDMKITSAFRLLMEEDYCQENKFIPRELKTCPEYEIDELIRYTQLNASQTCDYLEWIPFKKFEMIKAYRKCLQLDLLTDTFENTTSNYMIVMKYYKNGNLYQYLDRSNGILSWINIIDTLWEIARGLKKIHAEGKVHRNLHGGNLLDENF
ncbi:hypothetical protein RhiirA4_471163 [Rhizophagus irregularis]|uniref:Protein kinase domain-containing protein n=1 Tax=Rhizophagus irregularis TaxID=588596 RepID=A0A2I1H2L5_9GLOM|nr:hypothetical protein RhiirA4_471163 [Rhizophagus irregularis]